MGFRPTSTLALTLTSLIVLTAACGEPEVEAPVEVKQSIALPKGDIVFVIDESGSMGPDIADVQARVGDIASSLGATIDFNLGLVGFGAGVSGSHIPPVAVSGEPHIHGAMTADLVAFSTALANMDADGSFEPGFAATSMALSNAMGLRPDAGTCVVMITDEDSNNAGDKAAALSDLAARNAVFFGIVDPSNGVTADDYGPNVGSLAEQTGGQVFDILDFRNDAGPVLEAVLAGCVEAIVNGTVSVDIHPTSCPNPIECLSRGVIPVAIEGTESFDVSTVDPSTVRLEGVAPLRWRIADVSTPFEPFSGRQDCYLDCNTAGPDGYDDLTLKFNTLEVLAALEADGVEITDELCFGMQLDGFLKEDAGGTPISGGDVVRFLCRD